MRSFAKIKLSRKIPNLQYGSVIVAYPGNIHLGFVRTLSSWLIICCELQTFNEFTDNNVKLVCHTARNN